MKKQNTSHEKYSPTWYAGFEDNTIRSARVVIPLVMELIHPRSVVDVGCGTGGWLSVFQENGVQDISGVDGPWVNPTQLRIPATRFRSLDFSIPFSLEEQADLAVSLEVAEHLPAEAALTFVRNLTSAAPVILFSAAIPHQGGTAHLNEQWPSYWATLFKEQGYVPIDCLRQTVWDDDRVRYWYAQNMFIYVREQNLSRYPKLQALHASHGTALSLVHPTRYLAFYTPRPSLPIRIVRKIKRLLRST